MMWSWGWGSIFGLSLKFSFGLEDFLLRLKCRVELDELDEVKETECGAKNDSFKIIHFVDYLYIETFSFLAE